MERAEFARTAVKYHSDITGGHGELREEICELLRNLMHLSRQNELDWNRMCERAVILYAFEGVSE